MGLWDKAIVLLQTDGSIDSKSKTSKLLELNKEKQSQAGPSLLFSMISQFLLQKIPSELHAGNKNTDVFFLLSPSCDCEEGDAIGRYARQLSGHASHVKSEPADGWITANTTGDQRRVGAGA